MWVDSSFNNPDTALNPRHPFQHFMHFPVPLLFFAMPSRFSAVQDFRE